MTTSGIRITCILLEYELLLDHCMYFYFILVNKRRWEYDGYVYILYVRLGLSSSDWDVLGVYCGVGVNYDSLCVMGDNSVYGRE